MTVRCLLSRPGLLACVFVWGLANTPVSAGLPRTVVASGRGPRLAWRAHLGATPQSLAETEHFGEPVIFAALGRIVVGTRDGFIRAFDLKHGVPLWTHKEGLPSDTPGLATVGPRGQPWAIFGNWRGEVIALDANSGLVAWRTRLEGTMRARPVLSDTWLICTTDDNKVFALEAATGDIVWSQGRALPSTELTLDGHGSPLVVAGYVAVGYADGHLASYRLADGQLLWSRALGQGSNRAFVDADADPIEENGRLYAASLRGGVFAINPKTGHTLWQTDVQNVTSLKVYDELLWAFEAGGIIHCLDPMTGRVVRRGDVRAAPLTRAVQSGSHLYATAGKQGLIGWDLGASSPSLGQPLGASRMNPLVSEGAYLSAVTGGGWLTVWNQHQSPAG